jgi:hypothetical protein
MSRALGRDIQHAMRTKAGVMTAAALFYFSSALDTEAEPADSDTTNTEQAPAPRPTAPEPSAPSDSTAAPTAQKSDVRLPTVSVHANRPRSPAVAQQAPAKPIAAPPPPPQPDASAQATGTTSTNPPLGPTPYQLTNTGITRLPVPILDMPQSTAASPPDISRRRSSTTCNCPRLHRRRASSARW